MTRIRGLRWANCFKQRETCGEQCNKLSQSEFVTRCDTCYKMNQTLPCKSSLFSWIPGLTLYQTDVIELLETLSPSTINTKPEVSSDKFPWVISIKWPSRPGLKITILPSLSSDFTCLLTCCMCGFSGCPIHRIVVFNIAGIQCFMRVENCRGTITCSLAW